MALQSGPGRGPSTSAGRWARTQFVAELELLHHLAGSPLCESGSGAVSWVMTGVASNTHNGVTRTRLTDKTAEAEIAQTIERFRVRQLPATWFLDDGSTPTDLGPRLEAAGCRSERNAWVMGAYLADLPGARPLPDSVAVEEVTDLGQFHDWFDAAHDVTFDDDASSRDLRRRLYVSLGLGADRPWRHWLATDHGRPVGTASALFTGDMVSLDHIGVVPEHRHRGIGSALTLTPILAARTKCLRLAVLGPSPDGQPLYEGLGFELAPALPDRSYYLPM